MKYDFDIETNRLNTGSSKWDVDHKELPMSMADMDFKTAPEIIESIKKRVEIGSFGYSDVTDSWYNAVISWWKTNHNYTYLKDDLIFSTGVIPAISASINRVTNVGDNIIVLTPVYNIFFNSIINHGRHILESKLVYENYTYSIDFNDLEEKMANPLTTMMILCNPHNPIGKIWSKEELDKISKLAYKYNVVVLSDEIHCDLTDIGESYTPYQSVSVEALENSIICMSASKTFNLAGLQGAIVSVHNKRLHNIVNRALNSYEVAEPNFFVVDAVVAAFTKSKDWLDNLKEYLKSNKEYAINYIKDYISDIKVIECKATYLLWLDVSNIIDNSDTLFDYLKKETGLILSKGSSYKGNGSLFLRMNIATQKSRLIDGLNRLKDGIDKYKEGCNNNGK